MAPDIKIFVSCHDSFFTPESELIKPVQVGTALSKTRYKDMYHDDEGDNISNLNKRYCELTTQYWAWKNQNADYYGFMHYRRYFIFDSKKYECNYFGDVFEDYLNEETANKYGYTDENIRNIVTSYDVIAPERGFFKDYISLHTQYGLAPAQEIKDLDYVLSVIKDKYPEMYDLAIEYINSPYGYFCNMFIMKKEYFEDYCKWLFDILSEFDKNIDCSSYNFQKYRVDGFLAERLCGIYLTYLKDVKKVKFKELQRTYFKKVTKQKLKPIFEKTDCALVLSANDYYVPYLSTLIESIAENSNNDKNYDIITLHRDIHPRNEELLRNQISEYQNISLRFLDISDLMSGYEDLFTRGHFKIETYYRFFIQEILSDYDKVLYLDADMVVNKDIALLYETDVSGYLAAACKDADTAGLYNGFEPGKKKYMDEVLKIKKPYDYFQAGMILFNLEEMRKTINTKEMLDFAMSNHWELLDQDVLNYFFQGRVKFVDMAWNVMMDWRYIRKDQIIALAPFELYSAYLDARTKKYIIHYAGPDKPWDIPYSDLAEYFWKYARNTPFYEILILRMQSSEFARTGIPEENIIKKRNNEPKKLIHKIKKIFKK